MKRLSLTLLLCLALTSCGDRIRHNCDDIKHPNGLNERRCK